jgi:uncharacterized protein YceH (UPF0502 family)
VEKQLTTPQQYPLTLNALTTAANQATNRDPVVDLGEDDVLAALDELRGDHLVRVVLPSHGRSVKRYRHVLDEVYGLDAARSGLVAALLLRGPQTVGELRARTERMVDLPSVGDVQAELAVLAGHPDGLVRLLSRRPGQKEDRWQQIVASPWPAPAGTGGGDEGAGPRAAGRDRGVSGGRPLADVRDERDGQGEEGASSSAGPTLPDRTDEVETLRSEVTSLREAVTALRRDLDDLRRGLGG